MIKTGKITWEGLFSMTVEDPPIARPNKEILTTTLIPSPSITTSVKKNEERIPIPRCIKKLAISESQV